MDYNQLRAEWGKTDASFRLKEERYSYDTGFIHTQMKSDLNGLSPAERAEYIEIVAQANGVLSLQDRREILRSLRLCRYGIDGFLTKDEFKLFSDKFIESQEKQYMEFGRERTAEKLKSLNRAGMSFMNRKRYLLEAANVRFPMKEKGESMLKRALEKQATEKETAKQARKALRAKSKKGKDIS